MSFGGGSHADRNTPGWLEQRINLRALSSLFAFDPYSPDKSRADEICGYLAPDLATCINNTVSLLDVNSVTLGGIIYQSLGERLVTAVSSCLREISTQDVIVIGQSCPDPGIVGASMQVLDMAVRDRLAE
jgi:hypothetical protein